MRKIIITEDNLALKDLISVARNNAFIEVDKNSISKVAACRKYVDKLIKDKEIVYGLTTGFGQFKDKVIKSDQLKQLQKNLIRSHAVGVGKPLTKEQVRAAILVRINSLAKGYSGIKPETLKALVKFLNKNIYPYVPYQGSVGASGDLAPLSHIILVLMGEGEVIVDGKRMPSISELKQKNIKPVTLDAKEGLALTNGTSVMTGIAALNIYDSLFVSDLADVTASLSAEGLLAIKDAFDINIQKLRKQNGQIKVAANIKKLVKGSRLINNKKNHKRVQDSYSLRCIPQVQGACRDGIDYVKTIIVKEINAVTDNPLIFPKQKKVLSGGNFHGEPVALAMDFLSMCLSEYGNIAERRIAKLLDSNLNNGLPLFLINSKAAGLSSGFMIAQYTAASLVAENKVLAHPVSVDSIPTSANQEDHVSFGTTAAVKNKQILENVLNILSIEFLAAAQAIDFRKAEFLGLGTKIIYKLIRKNISYLKQDRILYKDFEKARLLIMSNNFLKTVRKILSK